MPIGVGFTFLREEGQALMAQTPRQREAEALAWLQKTFLFAGWAAEDLGVVSRISRVRTVTERQVLFEKDEPCGWMHLLLEGSVQMFRVQADGREVALHEVKGEGLVACAALFAGGIYPAGGRVVSPSARILEVKSKPFLDLLASRPDLSRRLIASLAGRITALVDRIESHSTGSALTRVAKWIVDLPRLAGQGSVVMITGTKKSAASALAMTPETFSRSLQRLQAEGAVRVDGRRIHVLNVKDLLRLAQT